MNPMSTLVVAPKSMSETEAFATFPATVIPVLEESIVVETRRVDQGGFRITKKVNFRDEIVDQPLTTEKVEVERRPIGRVLASMEVPAPRQEGDTWVLSVVEEVLVTEKRLMLKEEIRITRTESSERRPQHVTLRTEEVSIDRLEPGTAPGIGLPNRRPSRAGIACPR